MKYTSKQSCEKALNYKQYIKSRNTLGKKCFGNDSWGEIRRDQSVTNYCHGQARLDLGIKIFIHIRVG